MCPQVIPLVQPESGSHPIYHLYTTLYTSPVTFKHSQISTIPLENPFPYILSPNLKISLLSPSLSRTQIDSFNLASLSQKISHLSNFPQVFYSVNFCKLIFLCSLAMKLFPVENVYKKPAPTITSSHFHSFFLFNCLVV